MKIVLENVDALPQPRPRFNRQSGRCYEPARIKAFKEMVGYAAKAAMKGKPPTKKPVKINLKVWRKLPPTSTKYGDIDNIFKAVADSMLKIAYDDDRQIVSANVEKLQGTPPKIEIEIEPA